MQISFQGFKIMPFCGLISMFLTFSFINIHNSERKFIETSPKNLRLFFFSTKFTILLKLSERKQSRRIFHPFIFPTHDLWIISQEEKWKLKENNHKSFLFSSFHFKNRNKQKRGEIVISWTLVEWKEIKNHLLFS